MVSALSARRCLSLRLECHLCPYMAGLTVAAEIDSVYLCYYIYMCFILLLTLLTSSHIWCTNMSRLLMEHSNICRWPAFTKSPYLFVFCCLSTTIMTISNVIFLSCCRVQDDVCTQLMGTKHVEPDRGKLMRRYMFLSVSISANTTQQATPEGLKVQFNSWLAECLLFWLLFFVALLPPILFLLHHRLTKIIYVELIFPKTRYLNHHYNSEIVQPSVAIYIHWKVFEAIKLNFLRYLISKPKQNRL